MEWAVVLIYEMTSQVKIRYEQSLISFPPSPTLVNQVTLPRKCLITRSG